MSNRRAIVPRMIFPVMVLNQYRKVFGIVGSFLGESDFPRVIEFTQSNHPYAHLYITDEDENVLEVLEPKIKQKEYESIPSLKECQTSDKEMLMFIKEANNEQYEDTPWSLVAERKSF